jgi:hypothetical protein
LGRILAIEENGSAHIRLGYDFDVDERVSRSTEGIKIQKVLKVFQRDFVEKTPLRSITNAAGLFGNTETTGLAQQKRQAKKTEEETIRMYSGKSMNPSWQDLSGKACYILGLQS